MAFYFEAHGSKCGKLLGGGAIQDRRRDFTNIDHEAIFQRVSREWQQHHPHCEVHIEEVTSEQYGPLHCGLPQYNDRD